MIRALLLAAFVAPLAAPVLAQPMSAAEFEAYTEGRTLTYNADGTAYGIEEYLKNRHVRWAFVGDECVDGTWYEQNGLICFTYENDLEPQCWTFEKGPSGLIARFENDPNATELYEAKQSSQPMTCLGPKVGV
jgi:hypothetical protein